MCPSWVLKWTRIVPDFSLMDQNGETWTRDAIMGPNGAMLVFFRSASW